MNSTAKAISRRYDLHTHSYCSDGACSPGALVARAAAAHIDTLALTDHDSTDGLDEAREAALGLGVRLVNGVEISVTWSGKTLHIVGLNIDPACAPLQAGLAGLRRIRVDRAAEMAERLANYGISEALEGVRRLAEGGMVTRTHFAKYLYSLGLAGDVRDAFERYLKRGKPGYVSTQWAELQDAIGWIRAAGGDAVVAHPQRYDLTGSWLRRLLGDFKEMGGTAMEVASGTAPPGDVQSSAALARRFGLFASCGSDFHDPEGGWPKLGRLPSLPPDLVPVWRNWEE
jgi:predicted metal-dependent phosphoesterase TrpH